jgi:hypothetical protein
MRASLHNVWRPKQGRRGSAILEFTLAGTFIFLPILAGLATVGMSMVTAMQVASLNSTAAQMLASGVDFTEAANQNILLTVAGSLNTSTSGGGIVILSQISYTPENGYVCSNPIPPINIGIGLNGPSQGTSQYCSGQGVTPPFPMTNGQVAYVAETYYNNPQYAWAFAPAGTGTGIYVKAIF